MRALDCFGHALGAAALSAALLSSASAENIAVSNYGVAANAHAVMRSRWRRSSIRRRAPT